METDRIAKRVYVKDCLNVGQARRMVYDRNEWLGFVRGKYLGYNLGDEA